MNEFPVPLPTIGDDYRLSVVEQNTRALAFWQRLGFTEIERHAPRLFGAKESVPIVLRHPLAHTGNMLP